MLPNENVSRVLKALYPLGALLMLVPIVDWTAKVYPYHPGVVQWRFGALVSVIAQLGIMLTGFGIIAAVATFLGHRGLMRVLAFVAGLGAALSLVVLVLFALDTVQMRTVVTDTGTRLAMTKTLISGTATTIGALVVLVSLAVGLFRAAGGLRDVKSSRRATQSTVIRNHAATVATSDAALTARRGS